MNLRTNTTFLSEWRCQKSQDRNKCRGQSHAGPGLLGMVGPDLKAGSQAGSQEIWTLSLCADRGWAENPLVSELE